MNQYIYRIQLNRPELLTSGSSDHEARVLQDHVNYLEKLAKINTVLLAGRTQTNDPTGFGIVIFCAASEEDAFEIMNNDPAVKHGVMRGELFPYRIAVLSDSLAYAQKLDNDRD